MQGKEERAVACGKWRFILSLPYLLRTGPLVQLCCSGTESQRSYAGTANPARKGTGSHTPGAKQACPRNLREELKSGFDCCVHPFRNGARGLFFFSSPNFCFELSFPKAGHRQGYSSSFRTAQCPCRYQERGQGAELECYCPGDASQPLDVRSLWISWPERVPLCLAALEDLSSLDSSKLFSPHWRF